jgi:uncharacterized membrane protein YheB (UPF0754 family)
MIPLNDIGAKIRKLRKDAVPTIFPSLPTFLQGKGLSKRRVLKRRATIPIITRKVKRRRKADIIAAVRHDHDYLSSQSLEDQLKVRKVEVIQTRKKLKAVSRQNRKLEKTVSNLEQLLEDLKNQFNVQDHVLDILKQAGSGVPEHLFRRLTSNLSSQTTTREKYTPELRSFALTLHFYSPKAYR